MRALQLMQDRASHRSYLALDALDGRGAAANGPPVRLRVRQLGGHPIWVRPGTSDLQVVRDTFLERYHLPPAELTEPRLIWDLGSYIGTTMAHMCHLYPTARVVGVEMRPESANMCRLNTAAWNDRCRVVRAAVWPHDGIVEFSTTPGKEWADHVSGRGHPVRAISLNSLLESEPVDFLKMDIEGAELRVLRENTEWAAHVRCIKVEIHGDEDTPEQCLRQLRVLGFEARLDDQHPACVVGLRAEPVATDAYARREREEVMSESIGLARALRADLRAAVSRRAR